MLVEFAPDVAATFFLLLQMEAELVQIVGRKVDLVPKDSINRWIRRQVLHSRELMYGAAS